MKKSKKAKSNKNNDISKQMNDSSENNSFNTNNCK